MAKIRLRQAMLARRKQLDLEIYRNLSCRIQQTLIAANCFQQAPSLALYSPINNEVQTEALLSAALQGGKQVYYPRVADEQLEFCQVTSVADLVPGSFGVAEPAAAQDSVAEHLDLIIVPGVAFDRSGYRLGYGKGFYDRELARIPAATLSIGLCFDFQLFPVLPHEAHDRPVSLVITETKIIPCHKNVTV